MSWAFRFWSKVNVRDSSECWNWEASTDRKGYGQFRMPDRILKSHRVSYEWRYGSIPSGLCVCHNCDNPPCVNPDHLFLATSAENTFDMVRKGRQAKGDLVAHKGEKHGSSKLTKEQILEIRISPKSQRKLAKVYGVSQRTIGQIKHRETWRHI